MTDTVAKKKARRISSVEWRCPMCNRRYGARHLVGSVELQCPKCKEFSNLTYIPTTK